LVPFDKLNCQECGAIAAVMWWAILTKESTSAPTKEPLSESSSLPKVTEASTALAIGLNGYLDLQRRYQIMEPFTLVGQGNPPNQDDPDQVGEYQGKVLDCQPFQLSLLEALVLKQPEGEDADFGLDSLDDDLDAEGWSDSMEALAVPAIAQPYIALNNQYYPALPAIHNAWRWNDQTIVLLENRADYPRVVDFWSNDEIELPCLQVLHWFYDMVELWQALESWNCQQSLLVVDNLRVDVEDQSLCLQRLYSNSGNTELTLQDLGQTWQTLFAEAQKTYEESIAQLLTDLADAQLVTTDELRSRIEAIAQLLQPHSLISTDLDEYEIDQLDQSCEKFLFSSSFDDAGEMNPPKFRQLELSSDASESNQESSMENDEIPTIVLPMQLFSLEEVGRTDVGNQREHNEDYFGVETQVAKLESPSGKTLHARNLYILCDGMGGHAGGEIASALAVDTIRQFFKEKWQNAAFPGSGSDSLPDVAMLSEVVLLANKAIYDVNQQNARSGSGRMGTTLVMMLIQDTEVAVAHVGDSRLYRYTRKRGLEQITVDHEVGQREIQRGVDPDIAYSRPDAYQLTQALGPRDAHFVKPDIQFFELNEDMLLMLCSDGLSDNDLLEKHAESHIQPLLSSQTNLEKGMNELMELANRYNGHDNITAIAVRAKVRPSLDHLR
jgi:protein phosphatase